MFKSAEELRREFEVVLAGRTPAQLIHQCGSGVSACANIIAMEHAGLYGSRLYAGSWSEWCADPSRPVAQLGPAPIAIVAPGLHALAHEVFTTLPISCSDGR